MTVDSDDLSRTRLRVRSLEDLSVMAAMVQDAIVPIGDIAYLQDERSFVLVLIRFCWEKEAAADRHERVHAGLRIDTVNRVRYRHLDLRDRGQFLSFLTITYDEGIVTLHFSGGGTIRLEVESLNCALEDLSEPWPTQWTPHHDAE